MTIAVEFSEVSRIYGDVRAVDRVSITIADGEFFSMLGPSGSGKTTCLRMIAGFEQPSTGSIRIHGREAAGLPPYARDVNTVFQDYALFPHMNVRDNVAYGLKVKGVTKPERHRRAEELLSMVALDGFGDRKPAQLSGGQRQRVALARALINQPRVLLLDEPLGALDLKLREQMQTELKNLQRRLGITFIYVTHDQGEALSMSDRVAVFHRGRIEQCDAPRALYQHPKTRFVAQFVGTSNVLDGALAEQLAGKSSAFSIRPEQIRLTSSSLDRSDDIRTRGRLLDIQYHGAFSRYELALADASVIAVQLPSEAEKFGPLVIGAELELRWPRAAMVMLDAEVAG